MVRPPFLFGTTLTEEGESGSSEGDFLAYGLVVLAAVFQSGAIVCTRALKPVDVFVISSWIGSSALKYHYLLSREMILCHSIKPFKGKILSIC